MRVGRERKRRFPQSLKVLRRKFCQSLGVNSYEMQDCESDSPLDIDIEDFYLKLTSKFNVDG